MSRRGALALVGSGALLMAVLTAGQTLGGITRDAALLLPRGRSRGPHDFQVNRTAIAAGIDPRRTGTQWRLTLTGGASTVVVDRAHWPGWRNEARDFRSPASKDGRAPKPGAAYRWPS
ncbi:oxidoreductase, molybdopterin binding domain protein [Mycobacterium xenopi 3993]|nr:oxidoreductase, molybdopterin binding domain protein [Mycobacterium xenopi 3993]